MRQEFYIRFISILRPVFLSTFTEYEVLCEDVVLNYLGGVAYYQNFTVAIFSSIHVSVFLKIAL